MKQRDQSKYLGHYDHPHVSRQEPCWGSYYETYQRCVKNYDVVGTINLILDYLNSCDRYGWYYPVMNWANAEQQSQFSDVCYRCWAHHDECECEYCSNCDNPINDCDCSYCDYCDAYGDDCECLRCPDSYDRLEDGEFPDNQCFRCSMCYKNLDTEQWECGYNGTGDDAHFYNDLYEITHSDSHRYNIIQDNQVRNVRNNERTTA